MTSKTLSARDRAKLFACLDGVSHAGLAVSGGADSMALMYCVHQWRRKTARAGLKLTVLTVDHGLRPEAARETEWVEEQARDIGLDCAILRWKPGKKRSGIQADARQARYDLMAGYAYENGLDALLTAHHLDDQAETLLMRLGRGSGVDGLAGIRPRSRWAGLALFRPFIDVPKARLVATLRKSGINWLEDPSNDDTRFERVRLRQAMAELDRLGISADALARSARRMRRASEALEHAAGCFLERHAILDDTGFCRLDAAAFSAAPEETALRALSRIIQGVGGRVAPPQMAKLEALMDALRGSDDASATLGGCAVRSEKGAVLVMRESGRRGPKELVLQPGHSCLWDGRYRVSLGKTCTAPVRVRALGQDGYGTIRARLGKAVILPDKAAASLISFWRDDALLAVPPLKYAVHPEQSAEYVAEFVNSSLFGVNR